MIELTECNPGNYYALLHNLARACNVTSSRHLMELQSARYAKRVTTLRASALHDAWWRAMEDGIYKCESRKNADKEYIFICQEDGSKATLRKLGLSIGRKLNFPSCK